MSKHFVLSTRPPKKWVAGGNEKLSRDKGGRLNLRGHPPPDNRQHKHHAFHHVFKRSGFNSIINALGSQLCLVVFSWEDKASLLAS